MTQESSGDQQSTRLESTIGDRLRFVIWFAALRLGAWTSKEFAAAVGKAESQLSRWVRDAPRPDWSNTKDIAGKVGVSAAWLDDPASPDAQEPELFQPWLRARREFVARFSQADDRPDYMKAAERAGAEVVSADNDARFRPSTAKKPKKKVASGSTRRKR